MAEKHIDSHDRPVLKYKRISADAQAPTKGSEFAAGLDLRSARDYTICPKGKQLIDTDIEIAVPHGYYGRIAPRSGLALRNFIDVGGGVIDEDYRGPVGVILYNFGFDEFKIKRGDRIAQLICEKICYPVLQEVETLPKTNRGKSGFGASGML